LLESKQIKHFLFTLPYLSSPRKRFCKVHEGIVK
jgi:hypothetical protein